MQTMHLFAGAGGGLLADRILGHDPIIAVEWDAYCCQVLRERAAEGWFPNLSVWEGDVRLFDPSEYAGRVDCIHAGFPCQDISVAGNRAGVGHETRSGLYREVLRIAGVVRPEYLFLENVAAIVTNGLGTVLADLMSLGYDSEWLCLRASDCGANHHRDRWWLLTKSDSGSGRADARARSRTEEERKELFSKDRKALPSDFETICGDVADSKELFCDVSDDNAGISMEYGQIPEFGNSCWENNIPDSSSKKLERHWNGEIGIGEEHTSTGCSYWWSTEPDVGRVANGVASRVDRLKALGNGQVPLQAALAWKLLGGP